MSAAGDRLTMAADVSVVISPIGCVSVGDEVTSADGLNERSSPYRGRCARQPCVLCQEHGFQLAPASSSYLIRIRS